MVLLQKRIRNEFTRILLFSSNCYDNQLYVYGKENNWNLTREDLVLAKKGKP